MTDPAEARAREYIATNEPQTSTAEPDIINGILLVAVEDIPRWWRRTHPDHAWTDEEALSSYIAVNWGQRVVWPCPSHAGYRAGLEAAAVHFDELSERMPGYINAWSFADVASHIRKVAAALPVPEEAGVELETTAEERQAWLQRADDAGRLARDIDRLLASHKDEEREPDERFVITRTPGTIS